MITESEQRKIIVALSGGVDSAVAAAILKKQGYDVIGVYFWLFGKIWKSGFQMKKLAEKLGIPLAVVDARKEFRKKIIDYFIESYKKGLTPNPCVVCNREMKFRLLVGLMRKYKADFVATGHYARIRATRNSQLVTQKRKLRVTRYALRGAKDKSKDQSYFLYRLTQKDLARIVFPLGDYKKSEVKKLAQKMKLPTLEEESQDICFLRGRDINSYLKKYIKTETGDIVDEAGKVLGKHKGLPFYTFGQRKGIKIGGTGPYFVVGKNLHQNKLIVTNDPKKLLAKKFFVSGANWISGPPKFPLRAKVQTRYRAGKFSAIIRKAKGGKLEVGSEKYLRAVTPGQSAVFYKNGEVLGGGIIIS